MAIVKTQAKETKKAPAKKAAAPKAPKAPKAPRAPKEIVTKEKANVRSFIGTVKSVTDAHSVSVTVARTVLHEKYGKRYVRTAQYACHLLGLAPKVGQTVRITACRPYSKAKRWLVREIIK